jgi:hypothetical protein
MKHVLNLNRVSNSNMTQYFQEQVFDVADLNLTEQNPLVKTNSYNDMQRKVSTSKPQTSTNHMKVEDRLHLYKEKYNKDIALRKHQQYNKEISSVKKPSINPISRKIVDNMNVK